jgi:hypothetical protein
MFKNTITILFFGVMAVILNIGVYEFHAESHLHVDDNVVPLLIPPYKEVSYTVNDTATSQTNNMVYHLHLDSPKPNQYWVSMPK